MKALADRVLPCVVGAMVAAGCAGHGTAGRGANRPGAAPTPVVAADPWPSLVSEVERGEAGAMSRLVAAVFDAAGRGEDVRGRWVRVWEGREVGFFEAVFEGASHEARDVGPWLEAAAAAVGRVGPWSARRGVVREVSGRECCMRRSFMAAALRGLAAGMAAAGEPPAVDAESVIRLRELESIGDAEVAQTAREAQRWFRLPAGAP